MKKKQERKAHYRIRYDDDLHRDRYRNDDYSRYGGSDFREGPEDNFELGGPRQAEQYPGVSGKTLHGNTWFNERNYDKQLKFVGKGPKGYRRSDDRIYEEVCESLMKSHDVDASDIGVKVENGTVYLEGTVDSRKTKIFVEYLIEDLPGIEDIKNELKIDKNFSTNGPERVTKKDLGVGDTAERSGEI